MMQPVDMADLEPAPAAPPGAAGRSLWQDAFARLRRNRAALAAVATLLLITLAVIIGPSLTGHPFDRVYPDYVRSPASLSPRPAASEIPPAAQRIAARMRATPGDIRMAEGEVLLTLSAPRPIDERLLAFFDRSDLFGPARVLATREGGRQLDIAVPIESRRFIFGTDSNGRDLLTRTLIAGRISLLIGLLATGVALVIGVAYGAISGFIGGRLDMVMMRFVDILYALPFIFFVIMLVVFFGRNFVLMFLAVGAVEWLDMARIVRGQAMSIRAREFVTAAEALGVRPLDILRRHVVPNTLGPVVVYMTLLVPKVILLESFLSFLGLGVQEPMTSWGVLISDGARNIQSEPALLIFPATFLVTTLLALNFLGDGLRDALDPRDR